MVHLAVLTTLMEGPVRPWQCLVWSDESPPRYSQSLPDDHTSHPVSHTDIELSSFNIISSKKHRVL